MFHVFFMFYINFIVMFSCTYHLNAFTLTQSLTRSLTIPLSIGIFIYLFFKYLCVYLFIYSFTHSFFFRFVYPALIISVILYLSLAVVKDARQLQSISGLILFVFFSYISSKYPDRVSIESDQPNIID